MADFRYTPGDPVTYRANPIFLLWSAAGFDRLTSDASEAAAWAAQPGAAALKYYYSNGDTTGPTLPAWPAGKPVPYPPLRGTNPSTPSVPASAGSGLAW